MTAAAPPATRPKAAAVTPSHAPEAAGFSFRTLLSEMNPLQYLPVIGTIYRAVTGDTIPETARLAGSLVVSGLTGGPIGLAMNAGMTIVEKAVGIDPERIGQRVLASVGIGSGTRTVTIATAKITPAPATAPAPVAIASAGRQPWSPVQLAAYGVARTADGDYRRGDLIGAEVLNGAELERLHRLA